MGHEPETRRRSILKGVALASVGALGTGRAVARTVGGADSTTNTDATAPVWPSYQNGAGNRGGNPRSTGLSTPLTRWEATLSIPATGPVADGDTIYVAGRDGYIVAIDRQHGDVVWAEDLKAEVAEERGETVLALADDRLVVTAGPTVGVLDADSGTVAWTVGVDGTDTSGPTVADGQVSLLTDNGVLLALDVATGAERWRLETGFDADTLRDDSRYTPAVSPDGSIVVVRDDEAVHAVDATDGSRRWKRSIAATAAPAVGERVYLTESHAVTALALDDGGVDWRRSTDDRVATPPVVADGQVFVQQCPQGVVALDRETGERNWRTTVPFDDREPTLSADANSLYVPTCRAAENGDGRRDEIVALSQADGTEQWSVGLGDDLAADGLVPQVLPIGDGLSVLAGGTHVRRFDQRPADVRWALEVPDDPDRSLATAAGVVYAATTTGSSDSMLAIDADTGAVAWSTETDVARSPVTDDRYVYSASGTVEARRHADGTLAWRTPLDGRTRTDLLCQGDSLFVGWGDRVPGIAALDVADGTERWSIGGEHGAPMRVDPVGPVVAGDSLVAVVDSDVVALDPADGTRKWRLGGPCVRLAADGDTCFAAYRRRLRATTPDGDLRWRRDISNDITGLTTVAGHVLVRTAGGSRYRALSPADGTTNWELSPDSSTITMPRADGDRLYAATGSGQLLAIDPTDGTVTATAEGFHGLHDPPVVAGDTVAVPSDEGYVYGFDRVV